MKKQISITILLFFSIAFSELAYSDCWRDKDGKIVCSDRPNPGIGGGDLSINPELYELFRSEEFMNNFKKNYDQFNGLE